VKSWHSETLSTRGAEGEAWKARISALPASDIFYRAEYLTAFEQCPPCEARTNFGGDARLFVYGDEEDFVVHPFFKRDLQDLPFYVTASEHQKPAYDIASPYGYAGPVARVSHPHLLKGLWRNFLDCFHTFCVEDKIVAEFVRLNPFLRNHEPLSNLAGDVRESGKVVYVDLTVDKGDLWKNLQKANRNSIARSRRQKVEVSRTRKSSDLEEFFRLYNETMDRRRAKRMYYFPREFYAALFDMLGENVSLFVAKHEDRMVNASLFIGNRTSIHYFLSGTPTESRCPGSSNLLLYEAMLWAKNEGYETLNLGGGYSEADSLFRFKSTFSRTLASFYTYRKVHDEARYRALCEARDSYDRSTGRSPVESDYFPSYRR